MPERFNASFWDYVDQLVARSQVVIDRPKGSPHPDYEDMIYPVDYGYLAGTSSSDGAGIDVWVGSGGTGTVNAVLCTVDLVKRDAEVKILMGCTDAEMVEIVTFINDRTMGGWLIRR